MKNFLKEKIYPEGTTTNGTCLITYKQGAFLPGEPGIFFQFFFQVENKKFNLFC
jgi:hypothetical protein